MSQNSKRCFFDIEVTSNFFCSTFLDQDTGEKYVFEISERKNDYVELIAFLRKIDTLISFNGTHYDLILINYLFNEQRNVEKGLTYFKLNETLKFYSDAIIEDNYEIYKRYKYGYSNSIKSIDLFLYWAKMTRLSKKLSLKSIACNMNWYKIQELPFDYDKDLDIELFDTVIDYNLNDVLITQELFNRMKNLVNLRIAAKKKYNFTNECLSWDGVKLGLNILLSQYKNINNISFIPKNYSPVTIVHLKNIIFDFIKFDDIPDNPYKVLEEGKVVHCFKSFNGLLKHLKALTVTSTSEINCRVYFNNNRYDLKSGGLHTFHNEEVIIPKENETYEDIDVSSYYPSLGSEWYIKPIHLNNSLCRILKDSKEERLKLKKEGKGKSEESELLKLSLNGGFFGNLNNEHSELYDMSALLKITLNGQLLLLMLCEELINIGVKIDMCNTDGITMLYHNSLTDLVKEIIKKWESVSKMEMESVKYKKVIRLNINNYLAVTIDDKIKEKGFFLTDPPIDQSRDFLIISKAVQAYFINGTSPDVFIKNHKQIYDFCAAKKIDKKYKIYWNGKVQQNLNRYYVSKKGAFLYKLKKSSKDYENILKGYSVILFNDYVEKENFNDYDINYSFYIEKTNEIINKLQPPQYKLL